MDDSVCDVVMTAMPFGKHLKLVPCLTPYTNTFLNGWSLKVENRFLFLAPPIKINPQSLSFSSFHISCHKDQASNLNKPNGSAGTGQPGKHLLPGKHPIITITIITMIATLTFAEPDTFLIT